MGLVEHPNVKEMKVRKDINGLIKVLRHRDPDVRWDAAGALGMIGEPAVESLITALNYDEHYARSDAAVVMGKIGVSRAAKPLIAALKDKHWTVRMAAAEALGQIGDSRAVEPLYATLKDEDWNVCIGAARALDAIGIGEPAVEPLIAALAEGTKDGSTLKVLDAYSMMPNEKINSDIKELVEERLIREIHSKCLLEFAKLPSEFRNERIKSTFRKHYHDNLINIRKGNKLPSKLLKEIPKEILDEHLCTLAIITCHHFRISDCHEVFEVLKLIPEELISESILEEAIKHSPSSNAAKIYETIPDDKKTVKIYKTVLKKCEGHCIEQLYLIPPKSLLTKEGMEASADETLKKCLNLNEVKIVIRPSKIHQNIIGYNSFYIDGKPVRKAVTDGKPRVIREEKSKMGYTEDSIKEIIRELKIYPKHIQMKLFRKINKGNRKLAWLLNKRLGLTLFGKVLLILSIKKRR